MLVLSRKCGQKIEIDGGISVQVISIRGNQVKIGIEAPTTIRVLRSELCLDGERHAAVLSRPTCEMPQELLLVGAAPY